MNRPNPAPLRGACRGEHSRYPCALAHGYKRKSATRLSLGDTLIDTYTDTLNDTLSDTYTDTLTDTLNDTFSDTLTDTLSDTYTDTILKTKQNKRERDTHIFFEKNFLFLSLNFFKFIYTGKRVSLKP
jgi:hypothetical protein